jgi:hypothetical protein
MQDTNHTSSNAISYLLVPETMSIDHQVTGDILRVTTAIGGPVLPGFGPSAYAEAALPAAQRVSFVINQQVVEYLMPPQLPNPDIISQVSLTI